MPHLARPVRVAALFVVALALAATAAGPAVAQSAHGHDQGHHHGQSHHQIHTYVALGDSYTAAPFVPTTELTDGCLRSDHNYPSLAAAALGTTLTDVSCSGAQTKDMTTSQLPGVAPQFAALNKDTDLVTVSIGGNDFSVFGTLVGVCPTYRASDPTGSPCRAAMQVDGHDMLLTDVAHTAGRVAVVVRQIHRLAPHARVLVVGYPQIAPSHGTCPALLPLADGDYRYAVQVNRALDLALRFGAFVGHAKYVDLWGPSRGHDICAADPWINGQVTDPTRALAFHPFAEEQASVAQLVVKALR